MVIEGNGTRESHFGNGYSVSDKMYTLNTVEQHAIVFEAQNCIASKTGVAPTIQGSRADDHHIPSVAILNDQGGAVMDVSDTTCATLPAESHGHPPVAIYHAGKNGGFASGSFSKAMETLIATDYKDPPY